MQQPDRLEAIDYLAIGHITVDLTPDGPRLGGSAAYAALTAKALGWRVGILTAFGDELPLDPLAEIPMINLGAEKSSTFKNIYTNESRSQTYSGEAPDLEFHYIPEAWRAPRILHLAPVAREVSPRILSYFGDSFVGLTPQGWLRRWDEDGKVYAANWEEGEHVLAQSEATVLSGEDVNCEQAQIERLAAACPLLVVTRGSEGAEVYLHGEQHSIAAPQREVVDSTGAGDIFAAAFFINLYQSGDPLDAAQLAAQLASNSVTRKGLAGIPTLDEIFDLVPSQPEAL